MNRIDSTFARLRDEGEKAFIPYFMCGDPEPDLTGDLVLAAAKNGADIIELGVPYSAPLADGPTIQAAGQRSLEHGTNIDDVFATVFEIREQSQVPLVMMGYYNLFFNYGLEDFFYRCQETGVDGVIIPDLPPDAGDEVPADTDIHLINLIAPSTERDRLKVIAGKSRGFIYAVSSMGTTGARKEISQEIRGVIDSVRQYSDLPVVVGFGISKPEHVRQISEFASGVVVGSAVIKKMVDNFSLLPEKREEFIRCVGDYIYHLSAPLKQR
ncbi:MAG: tryptophan synthase subunit alpha [Halanaerobiaceae bacterium]